MTGNGESGSRANNVAWKRVSPEFPTALAIIQYERQDQLKICARLEEFADQLPDRVDVCLYEATQEKLRRNLPIYHQNEEALFERVREFASASEHVAAALECVRHEHAIHNCYADEILEHLNDLSAGKSIQSPSATGYMLRFCFDSIRRHIAWEDVALMPLASQIENPDELATLLETVQENRRGIGLGII